MRKLLSRTSELKFKEEQEEQIATVMNYAEEKHNICILHVRSQPPLTDENFIKVTQLGLCPK